MEICREAGPCRFVLYWQMEKLGVRLRRGGADADSDKKGGSCWAAQGTPDRGNRDRKARFSASRPRCDDAMQQRGSA
jgi:hypothetical protein